MTDVYSYSKVNLFETCALKYKYHYIDKVEIEKYPNADDPLILGKSMDTGIEHGFQAAEDYYRSQYPFVNQASEVELTKLKYWIEKLQPIFARGQFQIELTKDGFIGYADWYGDWFGDKCLVDFKYAKPLSADRYAQSAQLHLYYNIMTQLGYEIDKMYYLIIPKTGIRQKKLESSKMFYDRLMDTLESTEIIEVPVDYDERKLVHFGKSIEDITMANVHNDFPAKPSTLCGWCDYKTICPANH